MQKKLYEDVKADPVLGKDGYNYPVWSLTYGGASGENVGLQYLKVSSFHKIIRHGEPLSRVRMCHRVAMCCIGISV